MPHDGPQGPDRPLVVSAATPPFRLLKQFNEPANQRSLDRRKRLVPNDARAFPGEDLAQAFARALCAHRATNFREVLEAFEFFAIARKHVRTPVVVDVCGGHGLVAVLFAVFQRTVELAIVLDPKRTDSFDRILAAAAEVAPWSVGRVQYARARIKHAPEQVPREAGLVAVHACGQKTDRVLDLAIAHRAPVAVMPCCHPLRTSPAPFALKQALGHVAVDIDRTYRLEAADFKVRWSGVSERITRMHRVLLAEPARRAIARQELTPSATPTAP